MKNFKFILSIFIAFLIVSGTYGQITLDFSSQDNTICNGDPCNYDGPSILINEVVIYPSSYDGSIYGCIADPPPNRCRGEWIELYNPNACEWVDISCYFLGNNSPDQYAPGQVDDYPGGYIIPEGTMIPPLGFFVLRGTQAPPVPSHLLLENEGNVIEVVANDPSRVCIGNGFRLWFANHSGWFAFYDSNGEPQDAILWNPNGQMSATTFFPVCTSCQPCNPGPLGGCTYSGTLPSYDNIPASRKHNFGTVGSYVDSWASIQDLAFRRIPDGGAWDTNLGASSYAECNSTCAILPDGECDGTATVTASGGTPPYTYSWDYLNHQGPTLPDLCEGEYCVTVTDANNNTQTGCIYVYNITLDVTATTSTPDICEGETIHLNSNSSNGQSPYGYNWTGPSTFSNTQQNPSIPDATTNMTGTYSVTITDDNTCTGTASVNVNVYDSPEVTIDPAGPFCLDDPPYTLNASSAGGTWSGTGVDNNGVFTPMDAGVGTHTISIEIGDGDCAGYDEIDIVVIDIADATINPAGPFCVGDPSYNLTTVTEGGTWSGTGVDANGVFTPSTIGTHTITYAISGNCGDTSSIDITVLDNPDATITPVGPFCVNDPPYTLTAVDDGGIWSGNGIIDENTGVFDPLNAGVGTHLIAYSIGAGICADSDQTTIEVYGVVDATINPAGPFCLDGTPYTFTAATSGGVWSGPGISSAGVFNPSNAGAGTHIISYLIAGNCGNNDHIEVKVYDFEVEYTTENVSCNGGTDGQVEFTVIGDSSPYSFEWGASGFSNNPLITELSAGDYVFTITDKIGCTSIEDITITEPSPIVINTFTGSPSCHGYDDGYVYLIVYGGTPGYTYKWSTIGLGSDSIAINGGNHSVTVTDANECVAVKHFVVNEPEPIYVTQPSGGAICIGQSFTTSASATGGTLAPGSEYSFEWFTPPDSYYYGSHLEVSPETNTTYTLIVTDDNGCESSPRYVTVNIYPPLSIVATSTPDQVCVGENVTVNLVVQGGNGGPYTITFNNELVVTTPHIFSPPETGYYVYKVQDGCGTPIDKDSIYVIVHPLPEVSFYAQPTKSCPPGVIRFFETTGGHNQTFLWNFGDGGYSIERNPVYTYKVTGVYTVSLTVWSEFGCKNILTKEKYITIHPKPRADFIADPKVVSIINAQVQFDNRTEGGYYYFWDFGDGSDSVMTEHPVHTYENIGTYTVTLVTENIHLCLDTVTKEVHVRDEFTFYAPTAFTPNGDGINDYFYVTGNGIDPNNFYFAVFDRWGMKLFETDIFDVEFPKRMAWNGTNNGDVEKGDPVVQNGVYVWYCAFLDLNGKPREESGTVTLLK